MIKLTEKMEKERFENLVKKKQEDLSEEQRDFIRYMRIKEEVMAGLEGF